MHAPACLSKCLKRNQNEAQEPDQELGVEMFGIPVRNDDFCKLRGYIQNRQVSKVQKFLKKKPDELLKTVLLEKNPEGHRSLVEIAHGYTSKKSICADNAHKIRIGTAVIFTLFSFVNGYLNYLELNNNTRSCPRENVTASLVLNYTSLAFTLFYGINQAAALKTKKDEARILNDSLVIYDAVVNKKNQLQQLVDASNEPTIKPKRKDKNKQ